jgi:hypothetical protein
VIVTSQQQTLKKVLQKNSWTDYFSKTKNRNSICTILVYRSIFETRKFHLQFVDNMQKQWFWRSLGVRLKLLQPFLLVKHQDLKFYISNKSTIDVPSRISAHHGGKTSPSLQKCKYAEVAPYPSNVTSIFVPTSR